MADTKISLLTDGVTANGTDQLPVARAGANNYITPSYLATFLGFVGGILASTKGGAGAISGALKADGAGVVSQAAAADLSNGVTGSGAVVLASAATLTTPIIGSYTFATLPNAAANANRLAIVTDIGASPTLWRSNSTLWLPVGGRVCVLQTAAAVSRAGGLGEFLSNIQYQFPAGFLQIGWKIRFTFTYSKAGTATVSSLSVRNGTAGTVVGDTNVLSTWQALNATGQTVAGVLEFIVTNTTQIQKLGIGNANNIATGYGGGSSVAAFPAAATIATIANASYFEMTMTPGATDTVTVQDGMIEVFTP